MVDGVEEVIENPGNSVLPSGIQPGPESDRATVCQAQVQASLDCRVYSQQAAYTVDSLWAAIGSSLTTINRSECAAYLANSEYGQSYRERSNVLNDASWSRLRPGMAELTERVCGGDTQLHINRF
jgi:hypothetical protein